MEQVIGVFALLAFCFVFALLVGSFVIPGVAIFWFLVLKALRVPKAVAAWKKWELDWEYPKEIKMLAAAAKRMNCERSELQAAMVRLSIGSPEWQSIKDELENGKTLLNQNNFYLAQAVVEHLERIKEIK